MEGEIIPNSSVVSLGRIFSAIGDKIGEVGATGVRRGDDTDATGGDGIDTMVDAGAFEDGRASIGGVKGFTSDGERILLASSCDVPFEGAAPCVLRTGCVGGCESMSSLSVLAFLGRR